MSVEYTPTAPPNVTFAYRVELGQHWFKKERHRNRRPRRAPAGRGGIQPHHDCNKLEIEEKELLSRIEKKGLEQSGNAPCVPSCEARKGSADLLAAVAEERNRHIKRSRVQRPFLAKGGENPRRQDLGHENTKRVREHLCRGASAEGRGTEDGRKWTYGHRTS